MRTSVSGSVRFVLVLSVAAAFAACGGDKKSPDYGPEDTGEDAGSDGIVADVAPDAVDPGPGEVVADDQPVDVPVDGDAGPLTCVKDQDCAKADIALGDCERKACVNKVCGKAWRDDCCVALTLLDEGFEGGLGTWTVEDSHPDDAVTVGVSTFRKALGTKSVYFGDPRCHTYYNGALDAGCKPVDPAGADANDVRLTLTSAPLAVPALDTVETTWFVNLFLWIDAERPVGDQVPDLLQVQAVQNPGKPDEEVVHDLLTSALVGQETGRYFANLTADLSEFAGQTISLRFRFDTRDANQNDFEGVYIDAVRVASACAARCQKGEACTTDGQNCTDDACQAFGDSEQGVCAFPPVPTCVEPECTAANAAEKCPVSEPCQRATCPAGKCVFETIPPLECCYRASLLDAGFEQGLDGFSVWAYQDNQKVRWQPSTLRSTAGGSSLYFGNLASRTYANGDGFTFGEATSAPLALPADGYSFLSFQLFLATEFDTLAGDYFNPLGRDFFEVQVVTDVGLAGEKAKTLWSSHNVKGTTKGAFIPVGVDLTAYAGKTVAVRFRFDTGDAEDNAHEGAYVDEVSVTNDPCRHRDCRSAVDCLVDGLCRTGACTNDACQVTVVTAPPTCCSVQSQCDDGNPCTTDGCLAHTCVNEPFESPTCCLARTAASWNFDGASPLAGFSVEDTSLPGGTGVTVAWGASQAQSRSAPVSLRFGNDANNSYDNAGIARGSVTTPAVVVPPAGFVQLSFQLFLDVELVPTIDKFWVDVVEGATVTKVFDKTQVGGDAYDTWYAVPPIDLAAWRGKSVQIRFSFDTVDANENKGRGVFVDDIRVAKVCP